MAKNDLNRCEFIGHVGNDVELKYLTNEKEVVNLSIACNWTTSNSNGVEWVRVVAFGNLAKICADYLKKGSQVYISGRLRTNKWQDKNGNDRYTTEIIANELQMLDSKSERPTTANNEYMRESGASQARVNQQDEFLEDDIPFNQAEL